MKAIFIKSCNSERFYEFYPEAFGFRKTKSRVHYTGKLFIIQGKKYVLKADGPDLILQSKRFQVQVKDCSFSYYESKLFSYLVIRNCSLYTLRKRKSIWELLQISTYDALEKIEDNDLFYLYDLIARYKKLQTDVERKAFAENF